MHKAAEPLLALPLTSMLEFSVFVRLFWGILDVLRARRTEELIQVAGQHTVIQLALLIGGAGLQTIAFQALICVIAAAFINLVWARVINLLFLSASKNKYKYFRFVREDDDDE